MFRINHMKHNGWTALGFQPVFELGTKRKGGGEIIQGREKEINK